MTSATGETRRRGGSGNGCGRGKSGGFTLIEILVVLSIILVLAGLILVVMGSTTAKARKEATVALFDKLSIQIDKYREYTGKYPPDGFDFPVERKDGKSLTGSAALIHYLTEPVTELRVTGGVETPIVHEPIVDVFEARVLSEPVEGVQYLVDGFSRKIYYDNTEDGESTPPDDFDELLGGDMKGGIRVEQGYRLWAPGLQEYETELGETDKGNKEE